MVCSRAAERIVGARFAKCQRPDSADANAHGTLTVHVVEKPAEWDPLEALINCLWMTVSPEVIPVHKAYIPSVGTIESLWSK